MSWARTIGAASLGLGVSMLAVTPSAVAEGDDECVYASPQPAEVDFDDPRTRLQRQADLDVPTGAVIGEIEIHRRRIFDQREVERDGWFRRWTNRYHILTREDAVAAQVLFESGEPYDPAVLEETERVLRGRGYLLDAWVAPYRVCGERVDVVVVTQDVWTLRPEIDYSRTGGETSAALGVSDSNFLGHGKSLGFKYRTGPERDERLLEYSDPNVRGSRWVADLRVADNSDGYEFFGRTERPFYRFGAQWSTGLEAQTLRREDQFHFRGDVVNAFRRDADSFGMFGAYSLGVHDDTDRRVLFGYRYRDDAFAPINEHPPPDPFPRDRTLSYPWIGFEYVENRFLRTMNFTRLHRIEDIREGMRFQARLGWSDEGLGASEDRLVLETFLRDAPIATRDHFLEYELRQIGWYNTDESGIENLELGMLWRYFHRVRGDKQSWYVAADVTYLDEPTADNRLWLGGETGLRGYPFRYQTGDRRALLTVERRYYSDWNPFGLFHLGGVAFLDIGRAWFSDRPNGPDGGWLRDVGVGLRLAADRFESSRILHLDLAFPLDGDPDIDDVQLLVRGESTF